MTDNIARLLALMGGNGGSGGTTDYEALTNKPQINGITLVGDKTLSDLGIEWIWRGTRAEYEAAAATIPPNTFVDITDEPDMDLVPTDGSTNPVESNGVYDALAGKVDKMQGKGLSTEDYTTAERTKLAKVDANIDNAPTIASSHPVSSGGVYDALASKVDKVIGKGLSTNDYTNAEKLKLAIIDSLIDDTPTSGSSHPVRSGGVYDALTGKQGTIDSSHKLSADLVDDTSTTNKFVSAAEKTNIGTSATKLTGVDSSATDYIQLTNGKRLYLSDTEPTGTIPDGAYWIGGTVST